MRPPYLLAAALASRVTAQTSATIATIFDAVVLSQRPQHSVVASVINAQDMVLTFAVGCARGASGDDCQLKDSVTVIQGPSTWSFTGEYVSYTVGEELTLTANEECKVYGGYTSATCSVSYQEQATMSGYHTTSATSGWLAITAADISFYQLTVTAGASILTMSQATQTPTSTSS